MSVASNTVVDHKPTSDKPMMSMSQIFLMSFGFLGIQFGFALQNGNTSRILRSFGADVDQLPMFWIVAPLVGMIVQPIIGHYSDKTWNRLGRRKPYFLTGAILSSLALMILPNSGNFANVLPAFVDWRRNGHGYGCFLQCCHGTFSCLGSRQSAQ